MVIPEQHCEQTTLLQAHLHFCCPDKLHIKNKQMIYDLVRDRTYNTEYDIVGIVSKHSQGDELGWSSLCLRLAPGARSGRNPADSNCPQLSYPWCQYKHS